MAPTEIAAAISRIVAPVMIGGIIFGAVRVEYEANEVKSSDSTTVQFSRTHIINHEPIWAALVG
jgi:hypothetical protein